MPIQQRKSMSISFFKDLVTLVPSGAHGGYEALLKTPLQVRYTTFIIFVNHFEIKFKN